MILRNKQTGEVMTAWAMNYSGFDIRLWDLTSNWHTSYDSLAALNEEWEDYEEPKDNNYWYIDDFGRIQFSSEVLEENEGRPNNWMARKLFGNYFKTKEEAEKAVERLRAWKRLKDNGFKFVEIKAPNYRGPDIITIKTQCDWNSKNIDDLDLLFGGE